MLMLSCFRQLSADRMARPRRPGLRLIPTTIATSPREMKATTSLTALPERRRLMSRQTHTALPVSSSTL